PGIINIVNRKRSLPRLGNYLFDNNCPHPLSLLPPPLAGVNSSRNSRRSLFHTLMRDGNDDKEFAEDINKTKIKILDPATDI
ncbi:MAG TPA: hypothetical protein VJC37_00200, partial [Planctomycetota bacterium]|nr:hypothetical protein [Planctomycetota bacterium]